MQTKFETRKDFDEVSERWLKEEIAARLVEIAADPSKGISGDEVFVELEAMHRAPLRHQ
jgi:antitoxin ParD1/3/4